MVTSLEDQVYTPAGHLISGSVFTSEQLVTQFEDFRKNLRRTSTAPELVFERLVANLNISSNAVLEAERQKHARVVDELEKELAEVKLTGVAKNRKLVQIPGEIQETPPAVATSKPRPNPTIGVFYTEEIRPRSELRHKTSKTISFSRPYSKPPCIPVGLIEVDSGHSINPRVKSYASNIHNERFQINLDSWLNTDLYSAGCAWLEIEADDPDFQSGSYFTYSGPNQVHNTRKITFPRAYDSVPVVVVWLTTLDMEQSISWRVKSFATDVTATGFTIHIDTWGGSILYNAEATWVAYPSGKPGVHSGRFSTLDFRSSKDPQLYNSGYEKFGGGVFDAPPRTILAVDSLDIDHSRTMRLSVKASAVSATGMTWHLDAWRDTILYSAGAAYIALS